MISKATIVNLLRETAEMADWDANVFMLADKSPAELLKQHAAKCRQAADDLEKTGVGPS